MNEYKFTVTKTGQFLGAGLGYSMQCDIGKRVYRNTRSGSMHIENSQQLKERLERNFKLS